VRVSIDTERCTGHGRCYGVAPAVFTDDERGYGVVLDRETRSPEHDDEARTAARSCPEAAVVIESTPPSTD
jgi:ferredoxin